MGDGCKGDSRRAMLISAEEYARNFSRTFAPEICVECEGFGEWREMRCSRLHRGASCPECAEVEVVCEACGGSGTVDNGGEA